MLTNKIALVTGASRGIGRAIALRLASAGADVIITYLRKRQAAQGVATEIEMKGRRVQVCKANVSDPEDLEQLMTVVRDFGGLDILVANAATGVMEPLMNATSKHWDWTLRANAWGFLRLAQLAAPIMAERGGGRIIALTSPGSTRVIDHYGLVGTSKAALEAAIRYLAVELAPQGIMVNGISPGIVDTDAAGFLPRSDELLAMINKQTPAGRITTPEDVADVTLLLSSDLAKMIVGQIIVVDGGFSLRLAPLPGA
jgi:enoyl-[acyl-carrier protein] reductase III